MYGFLMSCEKKINKQTKRKEKKIASNGLLYVAKIICISRPVVFLLSFSLFQNLEDVTNV